MQVSVFCATTTNAYFDTDTHATRKICRYVKWLECPCLHSIIHGLWLLIQMRYMLKPKKKKKKKDRYKQISLALVIVVHETFYSSWRGPFFISMVLKKDKDQMVLITRSSSNVAISTWIPLSNTCMLSTSVFPNPFCIKLLLTWLKGHICVIHVTDVRIRLSSIKRWRITYLS